MKNLKIFLLILSASALVISCKQYDEEFTGAPLGVAPDDFSASALTASNSSPNFVAQTVYFESSFNASVNWTLELKGAQSGAIKRFEGYSNSLTAANTTWNGTTDTIKLFRTGETVTATLSVLGWDQTLTTTLTVGQKKHHGTELGTFENITVNQAAQNFQDASSYWWFFAFETGEKDVLDRVTDNTTPQGLHALKISGHDANQSYYVGKAGLSAPAGVFNFGSTTLNDFYFNIYVKGTGTGTTATGKNKDYKLVIESFEDDNLNGTILYDGSEDKYTYSISLAFDGWKLFSVKYSSFILEGATTANTYRSHSPDKIGNIGLFIGPSTSQALSPVDIIDTQIDFFTITTNGPMVP